MRKFAAILLLALFVFNIAGYRLFIEYMQFCADNSLEAKLDRGQYNNNELISIKIPINLPYQSNWPGYERAHGEILVNGVAYKYVKKKVYNDTMILLCIPHEEKTVLQPKANDFFGSLNNIPASSKKNADALKQMFNEFDINAFRHSFTAVQFNTEYNLFSESLLSQQYIVFKGQPPKNIVYTQSNS